MNNKIFLIIVSILIISVVIAIIVIKYTTHVFDKKQPTKKQAITEGYGYYSDPITTPCLNKTDKGTDCNKSSTYNVIFHCIPNPTTQKGCLDEDGTITYKSKVKELPCNIPCVNSYFREQSGLELTAVGTGGNQYKVTGAGCNKIINKNTGIDHTDYFFGDFQSNQGYYNNKSCVPENSDFIGYKQTLLTCTDDSGTGGKNNCNINCGNILTINLNGQFGKTLSKNVLQYFPFEYDQDGIRRNVCYDLNGFNQIEILNNSENVPPGFVFPDKCYSLFNTKNNINFNNYWPIGVSATTNENFYYTDITNYFILDLKYDVISPIINTGKTYEGIYQNYVNFVKVRLGDEIALLENMHSSNFTNYIGVSTKDWSNYFGNFYYPNPVPAAYQIRGGGTVNLTAGVSMKIEDVSYSQLDSQINGMFRSNTPTEVNYYYTGISSVLYFDTLPSYYDNDTYIYYLSKDDLYNNTGKLTKIDGICTGSSIAYMSEKLIPYADYGRIYLWTAYGVSVTDEFYPENLYSTGKIHLESDVSYETFNKADVEMEVHKKDVSSLGTSAYYYYGLPGLDSNNAFYYPLYGTSSSTYGVSYDFGGLVMYGDENAEHSIGPSSADIYSLEIELGTVKIDPSIADNSVIPYGFKIVQTGIDYTSGENLYQTDFSYGVSLTTIDSSNLDKTYVQLLRANNPRLNNVFPQDTEQEKRIHAYYSLIIDNIPLENLNEENIEINILEEKNYVQTADYEIFRSPYIINDDGTLNKLCFDENNKARRNGYTVNLQPGQQAYFNVLCFDYNFDPGICATCGEFIIDNVNAPCQQLTESNNPSYELTCKPVNKNNTYFNLNGFMEQGFNIVNRELTCTNNNCFDPFFTKEYNQTSFYQENQEVYIDRDEKNYFLSLVDNNTNDPLNPLFWSRIYPYNSGEKVKNGEKFFIKDDTSDTLYTYECTKDGIAPFNLEYYSINYQYNKEEPVYGTFRNLGLGVSPGISIVYDHQKIFYRLPINDIETNLDVIQTFYSNYNLATKFPLEDIYQNFINNIYDVDYGISSLYPNSLNIDIMIKNLDITSEDTFIPSFGLWNKFFTSLLTQSLGGGSTENSFPALPLTYYAGTMTNSIKEGQQIETIENKYITSGKLEIKKNDYYIGIPSIYDIEFIYPSYKSIASERDNLELFKNNLLSLVNGYYKSNQESNFFGCTYINTTNGKNINIDNLNYLPEFELIKIDQTNYNGISTSYMVTRNYLNTPLKNIFNSQELIDTGISPFNKMLLFYVPPGIVDLNYSNISKSGDITTVNIKSNVNDSMGISPGTIINTNMVSDGICWKNIGTSALTNTDITYDIGFNNYYVSRFVKNNIVYPIQVYDENNYYITNNNFDSQVYSIMTEIYPESNTFYMNEYRIGDKNNFNLTDTIGISVNGNNYNFVVNAQKVRLNDKNYDYRCTLQNGTSTDFFNDFRTTYKTTFYELSSTNVLYVPGVIYRNDVIPNHFYFAFVLKNLFNGDVRVEHTVDGTSFDIPSGNYIYLGLEPYLQLDKFSGSSFGDFSDYVWQNNPHDSNSICDIGWYKPGNGFVNPGLSANTIDYDEICKYQYLLDQGDLATFSLKETNFYSTNDQNSVAVKINQLEGKPPGPSYIKKLPTSNQIDKGGYGHILEFEFSDPKNNSIRPGDYYSKGGFILTATQEDIAEFKFLKAKNNFTSFSQYQDSTTEYGIDQAIEYTNTNLRSYFRNDQGETTFDSKTWLQVPESIYPENDFIFTLENDKVYYPNDIVRFDNVLYGISVTTLGSNFPTNFVKVDRKAIFSTRNSDYYFETNIGSSPTVDNINDFIINNNQNLPMIYQDFDQKGKYSCPNSCYGISYIDVTNQTYLTKINSNILYDFYNNVYVASYSDNGIDDFWSLSNTPVSQSNQETITFLQDTQDPFTADLYSQYVFDIPNPGVVKNGTVECSGTCFTLNNIIFSNSLLFTFIPQELDYQDRIKYSIIEKGTSRFIQTSSTVPVPVHSTSFSAVFDKNGIYSNQDIEIINPTSYVYKVGGFKMPSSMKKGEYLEITLSNGPNTIGISPYYEDIYYEPLGTANITNQGTCYSFGDIWYVYDKNKQVVAHGYLDPVNNLGHLDERSFVPIQLPNEQVIGLSPFGLSFVSQQGSNFTHSGISYNNRNYIFNVEIDVSNAGANGTYLTNHYYYNGIGTSFGTSLQIKYTNQPGYNSLQKTLGISNISEDFETGNYIYQENNRDDINVKVYSLFGNDYLSSIGYDSSIKTTNIMGEEQPGLVFKPLRNDFFSPESYTEGRNVNIFNGTSNTNGTNFQNIILLSQQGSSFTFRCNPYIYPLNNQINYNFEIGGAENPSIFNYNSVNNQELSQLNTIQSTDPSVLVGKSSSGISLNQVETINELFFKDLFTDTDNFGLTNRDLLFKQLRSNTNPLYKNTSLNCTMFYKEDLKEGPNYPLSNTYTISYANNQYHFKDNETKKLVDDVNLTCLTNYACELDQSGMTENPIIITHNGISITNAGGNDPYPIGDDNLYINYFFNNISVSREIYIDGDNFKNETNKNKFITMTYQSNIGDSAGDPGVTLIITNNLGNISNGRHFSFITR